MYDVCSQRKQEAHEKKMVKMAAAAAAAAATAVQGLSDEKRVGSAAKRKREAAQPSKVTIGTTDRVSAATGRDMAVEAMTDRDATEAVLVFNKSGGAYTITMNRLDDNGRPEVAGGEPIMFKLQSAGYNSSSSSLDLELVPPGAIDNRPRAVVRDAHTAYNPEDFAPDKKRPAARD